MDIQFYAASWASHLALDLLGCDLVEVADAHLNREGYDCLLAGRQVLVAGVLHQGEDVVRCRLLNGVEAEEGIVDLKAVRAETRTVHIDAHRFDEGPRRR